MSSILKGRVLAGPSYRGPKSDHFDGERFFNPGSEKPHTRIAELIKWRATRKGGAWRAYQDFPPGPKPPERVENGGLRVTFVNHATVLLQLDGVNVLTDPIWSMRTSPVSFAGPKRARSPGIRFEDLPHIDLVLLSHNHYDHIDLPTLRELAPHRPQIVTGLGNRALLEEHRIPGSSELDWWDETVVKGLQITCVPAQHFSNRGTTDRDTTLWAGFVIEGKAGKVYFCGDSGYGPHFKEIGRRLGPFKVALLPIGAYRPEWFMAPVHVSPAEAVKAHHDVRAEESVAIHFGTFPLADDAQDEPEQELAKVLAGEPSTRFRVMGFGEGREYAAAKTATSASR